MKMLTEEQKQFLQQIKSHRIIYVNVVGNDDNYSVKISKKEAKFLLTESKGQFETRVYTENPEALFIYRKEN